MDDLDFIMPFGKHRGAALRDLPVDYVRWILDDSDIDDPLVDILEEYREDVELAISTVNFDGRTTTLGDIL